MKTLRCDLCDHEEQGDTFEDWMKALMPHYMKYHADVMKGKKGMNEKEMKEEKEKWMAENKKRFDVA